MWLMMNCEKNKGSFRNIIPSGDQIATFSIVIEHSIEWHTSVWVNFSDFERAFDIVDCCGKTWHTNCGIALKHIKIIKNIKCSTGDERKKIQSADRDETGLPAFLFLFFLCVD